LSWSLRSLSLSATNPGKLVASLLKVGLYATPSINGRLLNTGFKTALVRDFSSKPFNMAVEKEKNVRFRQIPQQGKG